MRVSNINIISMFLQKLSITREQNCFFKFTQNFFVKVRRREAHWVNENKKSLRQEHIAK